MMSETDSATPPSWAPGRGSQKSQGSGVLPDPVFFPAAVDYLGERYFFIRECRRGGVALYRSEGSTARFSRLEAAMFEAKK